MKIGEYEPLAPLRTAGSGSARWCIAQRGNQRFFLKQFLSPVYPQGGANPMLAQKLLERCERFERQKQRLYAAMSLVIGDTLVPVVDFFRFERHYYAVSEEIPTSHITGEDALQLSMRQRREILLSLAQCLQRLHTQGLVHADLKPEHVLLVKEPLGYQARLIDLDSGFLEDDPPQGEMEGDPVYLAPEAFLRMAGRSSDVGTKLDTFAFGAIFHRLWTGALPKFDCEKYTYLYEAVLDGGEVELSKELPLAYRLMVQRMLHKLPQKRPEDAELVQLLFAPYREKTKDRSGPINGLSRFMKL
ncbi:MAG: lipopolysaccharide kinase InaA family protein [Clostridia bacterium]